MTLSHARYQQWEWEWQGYNNKQRILSAAFTVLITLFLSLQYKYQSNHIVNNNVSSKSLTLLILQTNSLPQPRVAVQTTTKNF